MTGAGAVQPHGARGADQRSTTGAAPTEVVAGGMAAAMGVSAAIPSLIPRTRTDKFLLGGVAIAAGGAAGAVSKRAVDGVDSIAPGGRLEAQGGLFVGSLASGFALRGLGRTLRGKPGTLVSAASMALHLAALGTAVSAAADGVSALAGHRWQRERAWEPDARILVPTALGIGVAAVVGAKVLVPKLAGASAPPDPAEMAWLAQQAETLDASTAQALGRSFQRSISLDDHGIHGLKFLAGRANVTRTDGSTPLLARLYDPIRDGVGDEQRLADMLKQIDDNDLLSRAKAVLIEIPTGSGALNTARQRAFEHLHGGDTLILARQYSNKRSVQSYPEAKRAGQLAGALADEILARLAAMPEGKRPPVFIAGESLGAGAANKAGLDFARLGIRGSLQLGTPAEHALLALPQNGTQSFHSLDDVRAAVREVRDWDAPALRAVQYRNTNDPVAYVELSDAFGGGVRRPGARWWQDRFPVTAGLKKILDLKNSTSYANLPGQFPKLEHHKYRSAAVDEDLLQLAFGTNQSAERLAALPEGASIRSLVAADEELFARSSSI